MFAVIAVFITAVLPKLLKIIFVTLGIGFVSYTGLNFIFTEIETLILQNYNNIGTDALIILNIANVDLAISIIISSYLAGIALKSALGGVKQLRLF